MLVNDELINKLAALSMLSFDEKEKEEIRNDLEKMIGFFDKIGAVNTEGVEPLLFINEEGTALREDVPGNMLSRNEVLSRAPFHDEMFIKVPQVIKKPRT